MPSTLPSRGSFSCRNALAAIIASVAALVCAGSAPGADITISGKASGKSTVSLDTVRTDGSAAAKMFVQIVQNDLMRSGYFKVVSGNAGVNVSGSVSARGEGSVNASMLARWVPSGGMQWSQSGDVRDAAHEFADALVLRFTGKPGMANSKILLVGKRGRTSEIYLCDSDGARMKQLTKDGSISMSPSWLPDRSGFLYTTFKDGYATIYKATFAGNAISRGKFSKLPGLNNGGTVSPDGKYAAMILSYTGSVDLYIKNMASGKLIRLTNTKSASESSPSWSPDSKRIAYVSNLSRAPHVYIIDSDSASKESRRLVYGLSESTSPDWGANNKIAFCGRSGGKYGIYVIGPEGGQPEKVSPDDPYSYEEPSWAPDGRHIVATRISGQNKKLVVLDTEGDSPLELLPQSASLNLSLADWSK